jgi:ketosteroid isomerase-like protein
MSEGLERAAEELNRAVRARDAAAAAMLLDDEFALTSSLGTGLHVDKSAWLDGLDVIETEELGARDVQAQVFGEVGVAVWRMDWRARAGGDDLSGPYVVSDVWLRAEDGWRLRWRSWARLNAEFLREELGA